jgi:hypothetical protein
MATIYTRATKGSALTWTEGDANITNLNTDKLEDIVEDISPQLGGALDVNTFSITNSSTSTPDIVLQPNATGEGIVIIDGEGLEIDSPSEFGAFVNSAVGQNLILTTGAMDSPLVSLVDGTNGQINIVPHGTGATTVKNIRYNETQHSLGTTSGTIAPDVANGNVQNITLNGNLTLNAFTSPLAGQSLTLIVNTNGTGRTLTSTMKWAGGEKTLSTTSTTDIISVFYDGTNYWASLAKGFV